MCRLLRARRTLNCLLAPSPLASLLSSLALSLSFSFTLSLSLSNVQTLSSSPCFQMQHRKGKRTLHKAVPLLGDMMAAPAGEKMGLAAGDDGAGAAVDASPAAAAAGGGGSGGGGSGYHAGAGAAEVGAARAGSRAAAQVLNEAAKVAEAEESKLANGNYSQAGYFASMTPLRLDDEERAMLGVLIGALEVSEYTDEVDTMRYGKQERIVHQFEEMMKLLSGQHILPFSIHAFELVLQALQNQKKKKNKNMNTNKSFHGSLSSFNRSSLLSALSRRSLAVLSHLLPTFWSSMLTCREFCHTSPISYHMACVLQASTSATISSKAAKLHCKILQRMKTFSKRFSRLDAGTRL